MKRKALFLDRDGVINKDTAYIGTIERFEFRSGIFDFLRTAQDRGYRLVIITNQSGVARGFFTEEDYQKLTDWMLAQFRAQGIVIDRVMVCFAHTEGTVEKYLYKSYWRKPNPGMILQAAVALGIDLPSSIMVGDKLQDMKTAANAGVGRRFLFTQDETQKDPVLPCAATMAELQRLVFNV